MSWLDRGALVRYPEATHWLHEEFPDEITPKLLAHFGDEEG